MRQQAQELNTKLVSKFIPQVKKEREDQQHDFTTADKLRFGGGVNLKSVSQMASNINESNADSEMEKKIQAALKAQGIQSEKDMAAKEFESLQGLDAG